MDELMFQQPTLITNSNEHSFYKELSLSLQSCNRFFLSVAFINYSGLQLLLDMFKELETRDIQGKIITSTYLNFTDVKSLKKLQQFDNIDSKIYIADKQVGFHTKGYIFEYDEYYKIVVGSSNITQSALKSNVEWNVRYQSKKTDEFVKEIIKEFNYLWDITSPINDHFLEQYEIFLNDMQQFVKKEHSIFNITQTIKPNSMQQDALVNLAHLRENDQNKALVIAATGTGKTYLSAFDVNQFQSDRVLFVVHREVILNNAMKSFKHIMPNKLYTIFKGKHKETNAEFTFAMQQTLSKKDNLELFETDDFDYIIIDEAHRSFSKTYQRILNYFKPKFWLGMTATPERTDDGNIFELFNNNIALEIRLRDALREELVIPFHYFGIADVTTDLLDIDKTNIDEIARKLSIQNRVDLIIEKIEFYHHSGEKRKCLGFCATKAHAHYMSDQFNAFGYHSISLTGDSSDEMRKQSIKQLESDTNGLEFIFTVDIFNEGVDIPSVNLILMLRPTESPIIFTQQLGRGLRIYQDKEFLTVLDFIGNHNKSFLIPIALSGTKYYDRDSLKVQVANNFEDIPGCTNIYLDNIAKEQILSQLDQVDFNSMKYIRKEYFEFKRILGNKVPNIVDYFSYETAPDPVKFILKEKSYYEFYHKMENCKITMNEANKIFLDIQRSLDKMLPIKRIHEFVLLNLLFDKKTLRSNLAQKEIRSLIDNVSNDSISHSLAYLSGKYFTSNEKNIFFYLDNTESQLKIENTFWLKLEDWHITSIKETLEYGILRYQEEYGKVFPNYPYLKLYNRYKINDMGLLTNYEKSFSSIRGTGVWHNGDHYYLFVDLHKDENIDESIDYKDKLISQNRMQWQTQNKTRPETITGQNLCHNKERDIKLHMFLRKAKQIGRQKIDYMYVGLVNTLSYEGEKPITLQLEFETPLSKYIYDDLTKIID